MTPSTGSYLADRPRLTAIAAASGFLAVALGAFGAHALAGDIPVERAAVYSTASHYHFIHVLALLFVAAYRLPTGAPPAFAKALRWSASAFGWGQLLFSGSLYLLATRGLLGLESAGWLGAITPLGGLLFLAGWGLLAWVAWRARAYPA